MERSGGPTASSTEPSGPLSSRRASGGARRPKVFGRGSKAAEGEAAHSDLQQQLADLKAAHPNLDIRARKKITPGHRVFVFLALTWFVGALIPLAATVGWALYGKEPIDPWELLGKGDLVLVALLASLAAFGELGLALVRARLN